MKMVLLIYFYRFKWQLRVRCENWRIEEVDTFQCNILFIFANIIVRTKMTLGGSIRSSWKSITVALCGYAQNCKILPLMPFTILICENIIRYYVVTARTIETFHHESVSSRIKLGIIARIRLDVLRIPFDCANEKHKEHYIRFIILF